MSVRDANSGQSGGVYGIPPEGSPIGGPSPLEDPRVAFGRGDTLEATKAGLLGKGGARVPQADKPVLPAAPNVNLDADIIHKTCFTLGKLAAFIAVSQTFEDMVSKDISANSPSSQVKEEASKQAPAKLLGANQGRSQILLGSSKAASGSSSQAATPTLKQSFQNLTQSLQNKTPEQAWFAVQSFIATITIDGNMLSRILSAETAYQQVAQIELRNQEKDMIHSEMDETRAAANAEAAELRLQGWLKIGTGLFQLGMTVALGLTSWAKGLPNTEAGQAQFVKLQAGFDGFKQAFGTIADGICNLYQADYKAQVGEHQAMRTLFKDKYDTTVAQRRSSAEFLSKLRDNLNELLQMLVQVAEKGFQVGQYTRS